MYLLSFLSFLSFDVFTKVARIALPIRMLLRSIRKSELSLIKIDAEGHDKDILKTIKNIISSHKPILITEIYNGLNSNEITDLLDVIHSLGYKAYDEEINHLDLDNLGKEIQSINDINPSSGHNLICVC